MCRIAIVWVLEFILLLTHENAMGPRRKVEVRLDQSGGLSMTELLKTLSRTTGVSVEAMPGESRRPLPTRGVSGILTRNVLSESLGPMVGLVFESRAIILEIDEQALNPSRRDEWRRRLRDLGMRSKDVTRLEERFGIRARSSYRPNDPSRPTLFLIHGLNSSSGGFVHMIPLLEEAGYGVVVHDYPFNQRLERSCDQFRRDWTAFRTEVGEKKRWAIIAHSMGALVARSYIEELKPGGQTADDVASLIMIAPVNQGAHIARLQSIHQLITNLSAINGGQSSKALAELPDGIGESAEDMLPGSLFLKRLNARVRAPDIPYHIVAGDEGFLTRDGRRQLEERIGMLTQGGGIFGRFARMASSELSSVLDELTDGTGDGCVAVEKTRLAGVSDHRIIHANHAALIRAPLLFPDAGPVVSMPAILRWLSSDLPILPPSKPSRANP